VPGGYLDEVDPDPVGIPEADRQAMIADQLDAAQARFAAIGHDREDGSHGPGGIDVCIRIKPLRCSCACVSRLGSMPGLASVPSGAGQLISSKGCRHRSLRVFRGAGGP